MPSNYAMRMSYLPMQSLAFGGIGANYAPIGVASTIPGRQFVVKNNTDQQLIFSFDQTLVNGQFTLNSFDNYVSDVCCNTATNVTGLYLPTGSILYVKDNGIAATLGSVYFSVMVGVDGY